MIAPIRKATADRILLEFIYKGERREIEPHTYGCLLDGRNAVCGWQLSGGSGIGFRLFIASEITAILLKNSFQNFRPGYRRGDRRFSIIYAEL
jgi:hypothetical protein